MCTRIKIDILFSILCVLAFLCPRSETSLSLSRLRTFALSPLILFSIVRATACLLFLTNMTDRHHDKRSPARDSMMIDDHDNCRLAVENGKGTRAGSVSDADPASQISTKANKQPSALPIRENKS